MPSLFALPRMARDSVDDFGIFLSVLRGLSQDYGLLAQLCSALTGQCCSRDLHSSDRALRAKIPHYVCFGEALRARDRRAPVRGDDVAWVGVGRGGLWHAARGLWTLGGCVRECECGPRVCVCAWRLANTGRRERHGRACSIRRRSR